LRIQDTQFKHEPFNVATPLAEFLISTGKFSDATPVIAREPSVMTFGLLHSPDPFTPPSISHSCPGCTLVGYTASKKGTAHKTPILHCSQSSLPDEATAEAYIQAFKKWDKAAQNANENPAPQSKRVFFVPAVGA
jgi:hypothetical protein